VAAVTAQRAQRLRRPWPRVEPRVAAAAGVGALALLSLALRAVAAGHHLWMDEGIAVGIASHPLPDIPGLLALDGSPPLYYLLLHLWMAAAGSSEAAVHWLSLLIAALCVPAAWWLGRSVADRRTGWILTVLVAFCPFVSNHAPEARMYALVVLLGLLCVGCFVHAYVRGRPAFRAPFGVALALCLYTHNWALFLVAALLAAWAWLVAGTPPGRRARALRDGALGFGLAAVLYVPWVPTLLFQVRHTGAPWGTAPEFGYLIGAPVEVLGTVPAALVVLFVGAPALRRVPADRRRIVRVVAVLAAVPVLLGWGLSYVEPLWAARYLAIVVAPLLLLSAVGLAHARWAGLVALAALVALWAPAGPSLPQSDAHAIGSGAEALLHPGDLVLSTALGEVPLLEYEMPPGLRYATALGLQRDPRVVDWRDVTERLARTSTRRTVLPLLDRVPPGGRVLLVTPVRWDARSGRTVLGRLQRRRAAATERALRLDPRFALVATLPERVEAPTSGALRGLVFRKAGTPGPGVRFGPQAGPRRPRR
jgi:mannosyltransferase